MADERQLDLADKAAAIFLGTPLLCGSILLVLAFYSPGSAPHRDRAKVVPVAIAAVVAGGAGGALYLRWRHRRKAEADLGALAARGALRLHPRQRTRVLVEISVTLADELLLPPHSAELPPATLVTAGVIADSVAALIRRLEAQGEMILDAASIDAARQELTRYASAGAAMLHAGTPLDEVIPVLRRHSVRRALARAAPVKLPKLAVPRWGIPVATVLSLALVFGTTIPLARWLDREHPVGDINPALAAAAKFMVKGGFLVALAVVMIAALWLLRLVFPSFPDNCRTLGHLGAYLDPPRLRQPPSFIPWTPAMVWQEVQRIVARATRLLPAQVRRSTPSGG